jgi:AcrR family transcriptional regulator
MATPARQRMLDAALELFHRHGVNGTSVDGVLEASGTGKSQFSHYFKTKEGLVHAVLQYLHEVIRDGKVESRYDVKTWDELDAWFDTYIAFQESQGFAKSCPLGTIGNDVTDAQPLLRQDVRLFFQWCRSTLARFFAERRAAGELPADADPDGLADLFIAVMQGGMLITKVTRSPDAFKRAAAQALAYVKSLRKPHDPHTRSAPAARDAAHN